MEKLSDKARSYARSYRESPYGREVEGTADLLLQIADRLAKYEDMHEKIEKRIEEIKSTSYYPHNFTGQMAVDLEWVLSLLN